MLAVSNFSGIKSKRRTIQVDHVANSQVNNVSEDMDEVTRELLEMGHGVR